jgi:hypothetical protein
MRLWLLTLALVWGCDGSASSAGAGTGGAAFVDGTGAGTGGAGAVGGTGGTGGTVGMAGEAGAGGEADAGSDSGEPWSSGTGGVGGTGGTGGAGGAGGTGGGDQNSGVDAGPDDAGLDDAGPGDAGLGDVDAGYQPTDCENRGFIDEAGVLSAVRVPLCDCYSVTRWLCDEKRWKISQFLDYDTPSVPFWCPLAIGATPDSDACADALAASTAYCCGGEP